MRVVMAPKNEFRQRKDIIVLEDKERPKTYISIHLVREKWKRSRGTGPNNNVGRKCRCRIDHVYIHNIILESSPSVSYALSLSVPSERYERSTH